MGERGSSGFQFNDYDNWNTNSNVSSHLCWKEIPSQTLPLGKKQRIKVKALVPKAGRRLTTKQRMKRAGNLYDKITSMANLVTADQKAQRGKLLRYGVILHNCRRESNLLLLQDMLVSKSYRTSSYDIFKIFEPKERLVYRLPYFPDRIAHHAIMNVLEPIFVSSFTADTYSCIKGRGIHQLLNNLREDLKDVSGTQYCLKLDIKKFYPSIDHEVLKGLIRRKFKDPDLLWLLDEIIDSAPGLPIGNYLSQYLANFYLSYFDHWIKEQNGIRYYYRYADDLVILSSSKEQLHSLFKRIVSYLDGLKLEVNPTHQVFPVEARGIDFVGYVFYHTHVRIRKAIKQNCARKLSKHPSDKSRASYQGWLGHCNARHLTKKLLGHAFI